MRCCYHILLSLLVLFNVQILSAQSSWYVIHQDLNFMPMYSAIAMQPDLNDIFAVSDHGVIYESHSHGYHWESFNTGVDVKLNSIAFRYSFSASRNKKDDFMHVKSDQQFITVPQIAIIGGDDGTVLRYELFQKTVDIIDTLTNENINTVSFNIFTDEYWIAGNNGFVAYSKDDGQTWQKFYLTPPRFKIKKIFTTYSTIYLWGDDSLNIYVKKISIDTGEPVEVGTDTLKEQILIDLIQTESEYGNYFITKSLGDTLYLWNFFEYRPSSLLYESPIQMPFDNPSHLNFYFDYYNYGSASYIWVTSLNGQIWSFEPFNMTWHLEYSDPFERPLGPILTGGRVSDQESPHAFGIALGNEGVAIFNGFVMLDIFPKPGNLSLLNQTSFSLVFSNIPNLNTLNAKTLINSNYSGALGVQISQDDQEPNKVHILCSKPDGTTEAISGERWQINFAKGILPAITDSNFITSLRPFHFEYSFYPDQTSETEFIKDDSAIVLNRMATNWVVGFFNTDDILDLITYSNDSLIVFSSQFNSNRLRKTFYFPGININHSIRNQLKVIDINHDPLPDLLLFDDTHLMILVNNSSNLETNFYQGEASFTNLNTKDIIPYNEDNNHQMDLLIVDDDISVILNIDENLIDQSNRYYIISGAGYVNKAAVKDLNFDFRDDLVFLTNGLLIVKPADRDFGLLESYEIDTLVIGDYSDFELADLDNDGTCEIVASGMGRVDAISYIRQFFDEENFIRPLFYYSNLTQEEVGLFVNDFFKALDFNDFNILDIAILKSDSLLIFQNTTNNLGEIAFTPNPLFKTALDQHFDQLLLFNYENDPAPEMALVDFENGQVEFFQKGFSWTPVLRVDSIHQYQVILSWSEFPVNNATLDYYLLEKSHSPDFSEAITYILSDTQFIDDQVEPFSDFWYRVYAVYNNGKSSDESNVVHVSTYRELQGTVTGVISDTTLPYLVSGNIIVPETDSLIIMNGVEFGFYPNTGLEVYGTFQVISEDMDHMTSFHELDSLWNGIRLYQSPDTAYFEWMDVHGAKVGIWTTQRPIKMRLSGILKCETALKIEQSDFWLENMVIDSVYRGIEFGDKVTGYIKNIDILDTRDFSILGSGASTVYVSNSIIWNNLGPLRASNNAKIFIKYSTVDHLGQGVFAEHVSQLEPIFDLSNEYEPFRIDPMSPTIDAGDPADPFSNEPQPNGGRINQGTFGNTMWATPSMQPRVTAAFQENRLNAHRYEVDSTDVVIKNWGYVPLRVDSVSFKKGRSDSIFQVITSPNFEIQAQDSLPLKVIFRPPVRGSYRDTLMIFCNDPHLIGGQYRLPIQGIGLNSKPVLLTMPPIEAYVDSLYIFKPQFTDIDDDTVRIYAPNLPKWLTIIEQQELRGVPTLADTGMHNVHLIYGDGHNGRDSIDFTINVMNLVKPIMVYPVIKAFPVGGNLSRQAAMKINITVFDSTENSVNEATESYRIIGRLFKIGEQIPISVIDTIGANNLVFYPLSDGEYRCRIFVDKMMLDGQQIQAQKDILFAVRIAKKGFKRFRWHMVAFPRSKSVDWKTFNYPDSAAMLFRWNPDEKKYFQLKRGEIEAGWGFWLMPLQNIGFDLTSFDSLTSREPSVLKIQLMPGWNQIGLPCPYFKFWNKIEVQTSTHPTPISLTQAVNDTLIQPAAFWFEQTADSIGYYVDYFDSTNYAKPWLGYWLYASKNLTLLMENKPDFPENNIDLVPTSSLLTKRIVSKNSENWITKFSIQCGKFIDHFNIVGLSNLPPKPIFEPPAFGEFAILTINEKGKNYCQYFKTWFDTEKAYKDWELVINTSEPKKEHHLQWEQLSNSNQEVYAYLVDLNNSKVINLSDQNTYSFKPEGNEYRFKLYVSTDQNFKPQIVPLHYTLGHNFPNPFNASTTIMIGVPDMGANDKITLKIYDILGKEIRVLFSGNLTPGFHNFKWNGTNVTGETVSSGIYFYQLKAGSISIMRKMVLLK